MTAPIRAYWWRGGGPPYDPAPEIQVANWGDRLNGFLLSSLEQPFEWVPPARADLIIAGSIVEHLPPGWTGTVVGAGLLHEKSRVDLRAARVLAVRGKLTADRVKGVPRDVVLGDPGLMVPRWLRQPPAQYELGVLPHWTDTELWDRHRYGQLIDPTGPPWHVAQEVARCKRLVTSSLHGMVVADAYGIPRQVELFPKAHSRHEGGAFKFFDYASIYPGGDPHFGEMWRAPHDVVERCQDRLYDALALALGLPPLPSFIPDPHIPIWRKKHCPQISILVPFRDDQEHRSKVWHWLRQYWWANLDSIEIIQGHDGGLPFSKAVAVNEAAQRARGRIFMIVDADTLLDTAVVQRCADRIDAAVASGKRLWFMPYLHLYRVRQQATLDLITTDPTLPYSVPSPPPEPWVDPIPAPACGVDPTVDPTVAPDPSGGRAREHGHEYGAMCMIMPREAFFRVGGFNPRFRGWGCCDEETEILTDQGWKHYSDVAVGDPVLTLNHETGLSEWKPVLKMNVYDGVHEMLSIESKTHSSLTTLNHRWPVIKAHGRTRRKIRQWTTSERLTNHDEIVLAAPCADIPTDAKWTDDFVALVAWAFTEGTVRPDGGMVISQSMRSNADKVTDIRRMIHGIFGPPSVNCRTKTPRWRESNNYTPAHEMVAWHLNKAAQEQLCQAFEGNPREKIVSLDFVRSLTLSQLRLFLEESMRADGTRKLGGWEIWQSDDRRLDALQLTAILLGFGTSRSGIGNSRGHYRLGIRRPRSFFAEASKRHQVVHTGIVWCPTTENGTWLARRHGKVYFTGNSEDASMLRALDTLWCQHYLMPNDVMHLWHSRTGTNWETRKWVGQVHTPANSRLAQRYQAASGEVGFMSQLGHEHRRPRPTREAAFWVWWCSLFGC